MGSLDLSTAYAQNRLLNEVGVAILAISLRNFRENAEQINHLLESADKVTQSIRDTSKGIRVDLTA